MIAYVTLFGICVSVEQLSFTDITMKGRDFMKKTQLKNSLLLLLTGERQEVKRKSISVIVDNSTSNRWTALKEGMEAAAKDYNLRLNYVSTVKL